MFRIVAKEIIWSLILTGMAGWIVHYETGHLPHAWFLLSAIIVILFPAGTVLISVVKKLSPQSPGWLLMILSVFKMLFIPALIIILFDRDHEATPAIVIPTVITYLILLGMDTYWKIKWLFYDQKQRP